MVCPRGGGIFSLYLGFRKKTRSMYCIWGIITFFFYSKANAPYFPRVREVGLSIDRWLLQYCIVIVVQIKLTVVVVIRVEGVLPLPFLLFHLS